MPSWGIHLACANNIANSLNIFDIDSFLIGNFMPDAERYVVNDLSVFVPYNKSHYISKFKINGYYENLPDYNKFIGRYKNSLNNEVILGYLTHLLTDYYFNNLVFTNNTIKDSNGKIVKIKLKKNNVIDGNGESRRILKQQDFAYFDRYILNNYNFKLPKYSDEMLLKIHAFNEINYTKNDIEKIINYLKKLSTKTNCKIHEDKFSMFSMQELYKEYIRCINFVSNTLEKYITN